LLVALYSAEKPMKGIGVDEDTALFVRGSSGRVVGTHGVFFVDPSQAEYGRGPNFEVSGVRLTYLTNGDRIDLDAGIHRTSKRRAPSQDGETVHCDDILSKLAMTELLEKMVRTGADRAIGRTKEKSPQFEIEVRRDPKTRTYDDGKQIAAVSLVLNVRRCA
jgi:cyanophycinase